MKKGGEGNKERTASRLRSEMASFSLKTGMTRATDSSSSVVSRRLILKFSSRKSRGVTSSWLACRPQNHKCRMGQ